MKLGAILSELFSCGDSQWAIIGALQDWATLIVDPSGKVVPRHIARGGLGKQQSEGQSILWEKCIAEFYDRLLELAGDHEQTFSDQNLSAIREYIESLPDYEQLVQTNLIPDNKAFRYRHPYHVQAEELGQKLTEYMLHLGKEDASRFLESIVVILISQTLKGHLAYIYGTKDRIWTETEALGYEMYRFAEGLEH